MCFLYPIDKETHPDSSLMLIMVMQKVIAKALPISTQHWNREKPTNAEKGRTGPPANWAEDEHFCQGSNKIVGEGGGNLPGKY